ncbi:unnamed protein product [Linum tenue]|uniref:Lipoxygenase domain-containing protein n=1 Tax=Linum tenue TaxID=586396 RepID=A0AAV0R1D9_9ROSI|nr:unnamed protein product [Linum tenue]
MENREELIESCTTMIWIASALHAATNFGQYTYSGYMPNRPTNSRRFMPVLVISLIEVLSMHSSDEVYLGQRDTAEWTVDLAAAAAFERFGKALAEVEERIVERNREEKLRNRHGPVKIPYTLLFPSSGAGMTGKGIPNSITI